MRELVYYVAVTLDGRIAAPDGNAEDFLYEGDHAAVLAADYGDAVPSHVHAALGTTPPGTRFDTVVMGWHTYTPALDAGITSPYAHLRQVVASRKDREVTDAVELTHDPVATVRALKREPGLDIYLCGGGDLAGQLLGEIDRLVIKRQPIAFRAGRALFGDAAYDPTAFVHVRTRAFESGVCLQEYERVRP